jgi:hypothetical protein
MVFKTVLQCVAVVRIGISRDKLNVVHYVMSEMLMCLTKFTA